MNTATRADLAEAAAVVLTPTGHAGKAYDFTGRLWTYPQLAAALSDLSGRTIAYREVDDDEGAMVWFGPVIRSGGFERQTGDLQHFVGHPAASLQDAVAAAVSPGSAG